MRHILFLLVRLGIQSQRGMQTHEMATLFILFLYRSLSASSAYCGYEKEVLGEQSFRVVELF